MSIWRGQKADLTVTDEETSTSITVGVLQDIELSVNRETSELYGAGSIKRQDVQATELNISITATIASFDQTGFETLGNVTSSGVEDSSDLPTFEVEGQFEDTSGTAMDMLVSGVYFEEVPLSGSRDEWVEMSLEGTGADIISQT